MDENEVMSLVDSLYNMISEAWGVPLGNDKCIIEREKALEILDEIKGAMPVELAEAKRLVSAPDRARAVTDALAPGTAVTGTPASAQHLTRVSPGSEIAGIPASVTSAQLSPASSRERICSPFSRRLCSK